MWPVRSIRGRSNTRWGEQRLRSTVDKIVQSFDSPLDEPVVNAVQQIAEALAALDLELTAVEIQTLEAPYADHGRSWA